MEQLVTEVIDGVQRLRFNRPDKKNALTGAMYDALTEALTRGDRNPSIRAHLFSGADGMFTAGNDIAEFLGFAENAALGEPVVRFLRALATTSKPMLAAVNGPAIGIGTTLLFHCDLAYASAAARFHTPFLDLGLVPEAASSLLAPRLMGHARAFELLCLGEPFSAEKALAAGLINAIVAAEDLEAHAMDAARRLAAKPPGALAMARRLLGRDRQAILQRMDEETRLFSACLASPEAREAFNAFLEKRQPDFSRRPSPGKSR